MKRLTYPHIATDKHPRATGKRVALSLQSAPHTPDKKDIEIAREILKVHTKLRKAYVATGEWKWINTNRRSNYLALLDSGSAEKLAKCFANMFRNDATRGVVSSDLESVKTLRGQYKLENRMLLDLDTLDEFDEHDHDGIEWSLQQRRCGNPYGYLTRTNKLIAVDTARHLYYANKIVSLLEDARVSYPTILEIGGGYGGLCHELFHRKSLRTLEYINCDLPETLYLCYYFLRKKLPSVRIRWALEKMPQADIVLVPPHKKNLLKRADIIFNSLSLSEMGKQTVNEYMALLHKIKPRYFLHTNSNFVLFPDSERHVEVTASEFGIKESIYKKVYTSLSPWQGGGWPITRILVC